MKKNPKNILRFIAENPPSVKFRDMMIAFGVSKAHRESLKEMVDDLLDAGELVKLKGNAYAIPSEEESIAGRLSVHPDGYGFVTPDAGGDDIYIPAVWLRENLHGDRVEVRLTERRPGKRVEGRIRRTLERGTSRIIGRFEQGKSCGFIIPQDRRIARDIRIPTGRFAKAQSGQIVVGELTSYPTAHAHAEGRVVEVLGWPGDPDVEVAAVVEKYGLPTRFPADVAAAAKAAAKQPGPAEFAGRVDLRDIITVTIDGETARDFDDAVAARREERSRIRLWVSIADVSHYVTEGSSIDREAYLRGTSVYFPDRAIPMLPEELSNGICSLNPHVDRLTVTAEMLFGTEGKLIEAKFYPSVIRSHARLTYTYVKRIIEDRDPAAIAEHPELDEHLMLMKELAARLTARRRQRGSIDFDLPEPFIVIDMQGKTEAILRSERNLAHRLIEEFMLAANEAVAAHLAERAPSLYRVHEPPDPLKLQDFREFIQSFGYSFGAKKGKVTPLDLQKLLQEAEGKLEERMINEILLRCMKQARYSEENMGHFGLAADCYTHFTSPIRRYPDLVVHRVLKAVLAGKVGDSERERLEAMLPDTAAHTSRRERVAMEAEREIIALKKVQFMKERVGEVFDGFITGVASFGFFVELTEYFVEGMVHVSTLGSDFFRYEEKSHALVGERGGEVFRVGSAVKVRLAAVNEERRQLEFALADGRARRRDDDDGAEFRRVPVKGKRPVKPGGRAGPASPKRGESSRPKKGKNGGPRRK